ncbi:unnamed protein product, partial [Closterium sp. NIES-53]
HFRTASTGTGSLQLSLSKAINQQRAADLLGDTAVDWPGTNMGHAIPLISLKGAGAGDWLHAVPTRADLSIFPGQFSLALDLRLGMELPVAEVCPCKRDGSAILDKSLPNHLTGFNGGSISGLLAGPSAGLLVFSLAGPTAGLSAGLLAAGGSVGGLAGVLVGGFDGGSVGGFAGESDDGLAGGSVTGLAGGSGSGLAGGSVSGLAGGSVGGLAGGSVGVIAGLFLACALACVAGNERAKG